ncbi:hypothetical protein RRG08_037410 [Elysia crispata]|uniref:Uncharacterized protein n=1 Tax=Elysia crispata TaxID=231223 RepID=A0AAE1DYF8_9GAST|nr:hypothetical protein RRG08_037410 [Elysia crispata]
MGRVGLVETVVEDRLTRRLGKTVPEEYSVSDLRSIAQPSSPCPSLTCLVGWGLLCAGTWDRPVPASGHMTARGESRPALGPRRASSAARPTQIINVTKGQRRRSGQPQASRFTYILSMPLA